MAKKLSIIEESRQSKKGFVGKLVRRKLFWLVFLIIIAALYYFFFYNQAKNTTVTINKKIAVVGQEDLQIAIAASGKIVAKDGVELSFPVSGNLEVEAVYVKEGDGVFKGDKIASVKTESLNFELRSAYNNYQSALASYNQKIESASDSEISKAQSQIEQAQVSLEQAQLNLEQIKLNSANNIINAETNLQDAAEDLALNRNINDSELVNNAYISLLSNIRSLSISALKVLRDSDSIIGVDDKMINDRFEVALGAKNSASYSSSKTSYEKTKLLANNLETNLILVTESQHDAIENVMLDAESLLNSLADHLYHMQTMLDATITFTGLSQNELDAFKSSVSANRSTVNSSILSLKNAQQSVTTAKNNIGQYQTNYDKAVRDLESIKIQSEQNIKNAEISLHSRELSLVQAENDYNDLLTPITESDLAIARAQLTSAAIAVDKAKYNMEQATLISPIDGIVSQLNYKQGDIILSDSAKTMATIINNETLFIEVNIEEADISKLALDQKAQVTFEAVENLRLEGEVSFISLTSEISSNGIVTYLVRIMIDNADESRLREGMTAEIDFIISEATNVLSVPVAAVRNIAGKAAVELEDNSIMNVVTGFTDGKKVEIISGLELGDKILY